MGLTVGIDLGTTNSCVAVVQDGRPRVIEDERGYNILPSCLSVSGRGRFSVGHAAKAMVLTDPDSCLYNVKRLIGRKFDSEEVQEALKHISYKVSATEWGDVQLHLDEIVMSPSEASSVILKAIKAIAESALGEPVTDAVITVPANFNHVQRKATLEAGEAAGLNVLRLVNEPTAAALAFGFKKDVEKTVAVYDLGGGTFDISVLQIGDGVYEILSTDGDTYLGGEDFDARIVDWLAESFQQRHGVDPREDVSALQRLRDAAERAKCELSFVDKTPILIPHLVGNNNLEVELARDHLEDLVSDLVKRTLQITDGALRAAGIAADELDDLILVGGMTRMPRIQEQLKSFFGKPPCKGVHPEEVVAIGAAVHGFNLHAEGDSTLLLDVTPFSLGVDTAGGYFKPIVVRNTTVPCSESTTFTTVRDNQSEVKITVRQGEEPLAVDNNFLGEFILSGVRPAEKMEPKIDVTFRVDSNGMLHVSAMDRDTGQSQAIEIRDYISPEDGVERTREPTASGSGVVQEAAPTKASTGSDTQQPDSASVAGPSSSQSSGFMGRLKKMAGFAKDGAPHPTDPDQSAGVPSGDEAAADPTFGIRSRSESGSLAQEAAAARSRTVASAPTPPRVEEHREAPDEGSMEDPFAVQPRAATSSMSPSEQALSRAASGRAAEAAEQSELSQPPAPPSPTEPLPAEVPQPEADAVPSQGSSAEPKRETSPPPEQAGIQKKRPARLRISYKKSATFVREYERNLKRGGTFIKTNTPLAVGRQCVLLLTVPELDDTIAVRGSVVWSSKGLEDLQGQDEGMGIRYDETDEEGMARLKSALSQLSAS